MPPKEVTTLTELKNIIREYSINTLHCLFEDNQKGDPPIGIRLYFYRGTDTYFLIDHAPKEKLVQSGIPVRFYGSKRKPYIAEDDVKAFRDKELHGINMSFDFEI